LAASVAGFMPALSVFGQVVMTAPVVPQGGPTVPPTMVQVPLIEPSVPVVRRWL